MSFYIIIRGPLGCGKTTVSKKLAQILNAQYFAVDKVLEEHNLEDELEAGYISQKNFKKANIILAKEAKEVLINGKSVIFDGNFYWKSQIEHLTGRLDFPHHVFTLQAPLVVCIDRDKKRKKSHGRNAAIAVYKKSAEFEYGTVIDVNRPIKTCISEIISYLQT